MTKVAYAVLATLTIVSYTTLHSFIIAQEPWREEIVVSNLTLNLVLFVLLTGGLVPYITKRLFPKRYRQMLIPTAIVVGMLLILTLRTLGVDMRF